MELRQIFGEQLLIRFYYFAAFCVHRSRPSVRKWLRHGSLTPRQLCVLASLPQNLPRRKPKPKTLHPPTPRAHTQHIPLSAFFFFLIAGETFHSGPTPSAAVLTSSSTNCSPAVGWTRGRRWVNVLNEWVRIPGGSLVINHPDTETVYFIHFTVRKHLST